MSETERLETLHRYRILDTNPEQAFDDLTLLASYVCETPIALITLVDADRQWFKSRVGLSASETSRSVSFCSHAIQQTGLFIVTDATNHEQFRENPFVTGDLEHPLLCRRAADHAGRSGARHAVRDRSRPAHADRRRRSTRSKRSGVRCRRSWSCGSTCWNSRRRWRNATGPRPSKQPLVTQLQASVDGLNKLGALLPYTSLCELNMVIPADPKAIPTITDGVNHILESKGWAEREIMAVELALQEALANGIRHGCKGDPSRHVQCTVAIDQTGQVTIVVRDPGNWVRHLECPRPARSRQRAEAGRPRRLPDQPPDGRRELRRRRA